ncbi:hypothetical protein BDV19DRAFT_394684 [Aspergillus venezuelensis]
MQLDFKRSLPSTLFEDGSDILREESAFTFILAPAGDPYAVAALAALSIGGAYAPLATAITPQEGRVLMQHSNAKCILANGARTALAQECQTFAAAHGYDMTLLPISWTSGPDTGSATTTIGCSAISGGCLVKFSWLESIHDFICLYAPATLFDRVCHLLLQPIDIAALS